jgi:hypothetical protein
MQRDWAGSGQWLSGAAALAVVAAAWIGAADWQALKVNRMTTVNARCIVFSLNGSGGRVAVRGGRLRRIRQFGTNGSSCGPIRRRIAGRQTASEGPRAPAGVFFRREPPAQTRLKRERPR